jgi:hypothetical protein
MEYACLRLFPVMKRNAPLTAFMLIFRAVLFSLKTKLSIVNKEFGPTTSLVLSRKRIWACPTDPV